MKTHPGFSFHLRVQNEKISQRQLIFRLAVMKKFLISDVIFTDLEGEIDLDVEKSRPGEKTFETAVDSLAGAGFVLCTKVDLLGAKVRTLSGWLSEKESMEIFHALKDFRDQGLADHGSMYGKAWISKRRSIQVTDPGVRLYAYNGASATKTERFEKFPFLTELRDRLNRELGFDSGDGFNFCLVNFYTPDASLGWHSDLESDMVKNAPVASVSLGCPRRFQFKLRENVARLLESDDLDGGESAKIESLKAEAKQTFLLTSGYLLTMEGTCQSVLQHAILPMTKKELKVALGTETKGVRVNLTFRMMRRE